MTFALSQRVKITLCVNSLKVQALLFLFRAFSFTLNYPTERPVDSQYALTLPVIRSIIDSNKTKF